MSIIGSKVDVVVDRMMGTQHPNYPDICYPINYGYIEDVVAPDGEEQDAYIIGIDVPVKTFTGVVVAIVRRHDDVEEKWVVAPENTVFSKDEIAEMIKFQEQYFKHEIIIEDYKI